MALVIMKPHQLPPDNLISSKWVWWVMLKSGTGSWMPTGVRPCQYLKARWPCVWHSPANLDHYPWH
jgi:hypothetical protein